jgi:hypothetical protein
MEILKWEPIFDVSKICDHMYTELYHGIWGTEICNALTILTPTMFDECSYIGLYNVHVTEEWHHLGCYAVWLL